MSGQQATELTAETRQMVLNEYQVIDYSACATWGPGDNLNRLIPSLTPQQSDLWNVVLPMQDVRDDRGQGELVVYFAHTLSKWLGFSLPDRDVAILAAIVHDTGYSLIPNINQLFTEILRDIVTGDSDTQDMARERDREMRIEHQEHAADIAASHLSDHPRLQEIQAIVRDHDTRDHPPSKCAIAMWDADVLWRVTLPAVHATYRRFPELSDDFELLYETLRDQLHLNRPKGLWHELSYLIGRLELRSTVNHLVKTEGHTLPAEFEEDFADLY